MEHFCSIRYCRLGMITLICFRLEALSSSASTDMFLVMLKRWSTPVVSGVVPFAAILVLSPVLYLNPGICYIAVFASYNS